METRASEALAAHAPGGKGRGDEGASCSAGGYTVPRQNSSHLRVTTQQGGEHHEVVPNHHPVKLGTLKGLLRSVAQPHRMSVAELLERLDL
ncbi:hypothetical protein LBMAG56_53490 [Verrucomicrobiota bacterium]|nr:hypothetical protein LBMAG56_53490 [Verrucomicrobiota bacterium]